LLIADEPTTALDVTTQAQILEQLREIKRLYRTSIILITHDIALISDFADVIVVMYAGQVCEIGLTQDVIRRPQHPYTRALLATIPRAEIPAGERLTSIPGEPPDPAAVPAGCPFAPRCPSVMEICRQINPPRFTVGPGWEAACHLHNPAAVGVA
jgi:oligopeptide/dipeptide ABC transporter ATP-binding protein